MYSLFHKLIYISFLNEAMWFSGLNDLGNIDQVDDSDIRGDNPSTPLTPLTPSTPASMEDLSDRSTFSVSMDSGIGSPPDFSLPVNRGLVNLCDMDSSQRLGGGKIKKKASEHINKEKKRRDRIKDSCDQLRVLLPYIRGRKTDMASILEMSVDYLRIVNVCMPQNLQDQIVDILSKDPGLVPNKDMLKKKQVNHKSGMGTFPSMPCGRGLKTSSDTELCFGSKRLKFEHSPLTESSSSSIEDGHYEPTLAGHTEHSLSTFPPHKSFSEADDQSFSSRSFSSNFTEGLATAQQIFNQYTANKAPTYHDDANFHPPYTTESTLYHYYPSLVTNPTRLYPDVLSTGHGSKSHKADLLAVCGPEQSNSSSKQHDDNNNIISRNDH